LRKTHIIFTIMLFILVLFIASGFNSCSFMAECARNNTGTLTVTNNTNDAIRVQIDGVDYGYVNKGETLKKDFAAGQKYLVETFWPNGKYACSPAAVTVIKCESKGISCSATH